MSPSPLHNLAHAVVTHRVAVVALVLLLGTAVGAQIPRVTADFTPSDLFASFEGQQALEDEVRQTFGAVDNIVLVLVRADDVLDRAVLAWQHDVALALGGLSGVERVDGLTVTPIARLELAGGESGFAALRGLVVVRAVAGLLAVTGVLPAWDAEAAEDAAPRLEPRAGPIVDGPTVTDAHAEALARALEDAPLLRGRLVSADNRLAAIAVTMDRDTTRNADVAAVVEAVLGVVAERDPPDGVVIAFSGLPYVRHMVVERMRRDQGVLMPAAIAVCLLILLVAFRWLPALVLPMLSVGAGAVLLVGGMALVGEPFNIINNIVPMMVIIIGISNAIHLLSRYGEECQAPVHRSEAAVRAMVVMTVACFLTSFTTAVGFGSLAISRTEILGRFGLTAAAGVMLVYVTTLLLLPATLTFVPRPGRHSLVAREGNLERGVSHLAALMTRHARPVAGASLLAFVALLSSMAFVRIDSAVLDQFDPDDAIYRNARLVEQELGGIRPLDIVLRTEDPAVFSDPAFLNALDAFTASALERHGVLSGESWTMLLRETRVMAQRDPAARMAPFERQEEVDALLQLLRTSGGQVLDGYLSADGARARVQLRVADMGAQATIRLAEDLDAALARTLAPFPAVSHQLAGDAYTGSLGLDIVIRDLMGSLLLAFVIIFGFLTVLLRSLRLGLLSILPNVLPLVMTLAWMVWRDIPLNTATAIIFSISIGLAVDGTIHMLVRFREERRRGLPVETAISRSARGTGRAIVLTCGSLVLGFGVMLLSAFVPVRRFGELIAVTVIGVLVGTLVVLPALMALFAPRRSPAVARPESPAAESGKNPPVQPG